MLLIDPSKFMKPIGVFTWKTLIAAAGAVLAVVVVGYLGLKTTEGGGGASARTAPIPDRSMVQYTVEDDVQEGVWSLHSPVMERFTDHGERPLNSQRWIPNGTKVIVECARQGTSYEVELNGRYQRWSWYARLNDGSWIPLAGFSETTEDGNQDLVPC